MTLIFCIHYFLWYGAHTSIFGYESVYARHYTNASTIQYGTLKMILPFVAVVVTPLICSMADRRHAHRLYFTTAILVASLSMFLYSLLPLTMDIKQDPLNAGRLLYWWFNKPLNITEGSDGNNSNSSSSSNESSTGLLVGPWIYFSVNSFTFELALAVTTCLGDSFAVVQAEEQGTSFGRVIVWGTFGWALSALLLALLNQASFLPRLLPGLMLGCLLLTADLLVVVFWDRSSDFKLDLIALDAVAHTVTSSSASGHKDPSDYLPLNESTKINLGAEMEGGVARRKTASILRPLDQQSNQAKTASTKTAVSSIVGPRYARGSTSSVETINSDWSPPDETRKVFLTGVSSIEPVTAQITSQVINSTLDSPINRSSPSPPPVKIKPNKNEGKHHTTSVRVQLLLLGIILRNRKSLIRFFILFILSGFFMSMHWNYFFLYLEHIYPKRFELISALSMVTQSLLGELPFFILSRKLIDCLGRSHTISVSILTIGIRFLLYAYLIPLGADTHATGLYLIWLADCLQGPNYGLFYVVMTEVGLEYSFCDEQTIGELARAGHINGANEHEVNALRLALRSTIQSVAFACYEGIGLGLGSLVGGWLLAPRNNFNLLWPTMAACSVLVGLFNLLFEFLWREADLAGELVRSSEQREFAAANRLGVLRKVASPSSLAPPVAPLKPIGGGRGWPVRADLSQKIRSLMGCSGQNAEQQRQVAPPVAKVRS